MSPFRVGETLIAGRYRLLRFIAQGGMGEVYEAFDEELRQRVAMKVVRRDVAANPVAMERFKREISLARRVTHPNVSRIFEYGRHTDGDGAVTFLTMELLEGETLEERIRTDGPLSLEEARPVIEQMCEGLAAAHDAGVVHRDLKSSNVILVRGPEGGVRVVLTDFGLARALTGDDAATATLTATDLMVGTPAYMSPEQAQGTEITARSDLYSLGVVLFEMVTGAFPHAGATPMAILMNRLKEPPPSPLALMPSLDPVWDGVIRRCLEVKPERRFESARDVARALHGERVAAPPPLTPAEMEHQTASALSVGTVRRIARRRWIAAGAAAALLVAATLALVLLPRGKTSLRGGRRSAAVLGFKNLSARPDSAWLSTALAEMLTSELAVGEQLRTVPGETVARAKMELALPDTDALSPETLGRVGSAVGTDLVVLGSYFVASSDPGAPLRVDLRVQSAEGGFDASISETGTPAQVLSLVASLGRKLRARLHIAEASPAEVETARAAFPESAEAQRLYAEGLSRLRSFDLVEARKLLAQAADAAPKNALIRSALTACFTALGDDAHARETAREAFDLSNALSRDERLFIEAQLAEANKEWPKAVEDYRALYRFFPDDVEYALRLAGAQTSSGRAVDALATLADAAKLGAEPRVALASGTAQMALSRYKAALADARRCIAEGGRRGARLLVAQGRVLEGDALLRLGDHKAARASLETARAIFAATGDRSSEARAVNRIANVVYEEGDYEQARRGFEQARDRWRGAGNERGASAALQNVADCWLMSGSLTRARPLFEEALASFERLGERPYAVLCRINLANILAMQGDPAAAAPVAESAVAAARTSSYAYGLTSALFVLSDATLASGRPAAAAGQAEEALALARSNGDRRLETYCLQSLGQARLAAGDLPKARELLAAALALRRENHARSEEIDTVGALAEVARHEGRARDSLPPLRIALATARELSLPDEQLSAATRLLRSALASSLLDEARTVAPDVAALAGRSENVPKKLAATIARAELFLSEGQPGAAAAAAEAAEGEASRRGLVLLAGEAQLLRGRAEMAAGDATSGRRRLETLAKEEEARGLLLLAREAALAARR